MHNIFCLTLDFIVLCLLFCCNTEDTLKKASHTFAVCAEETKPTLAKEKTNPRTQQRERPMLAHYLDNTVGDGWRQSGSVQSPQSGVLMIPTLPCGIWCHTGLCLWMAMCSSPLISNRWWETSKWWSFTKTSSQNKVKGTQRNTTPSDCLKKEKSIGF